MFTQHRRNAAKEAREPGETRKNETTSPSFFSWIPGFLRGPFFGIPEVKDEDGDD
jgi:hypothetical protein